MEAASSMGTRVSANVFESQHVRRAGPILSLPESPHQQDSRRDDPHKQRNQSKGERGVDSE